MKCERCGEVLTTEDIFCTNCGAPVNSIQTPNVVEQTSPQVPYNKVQTENAYTKEDDKIANRLCIYSLLLQYVAPFAIAIISGIISVISEELGYLVAIFSSLCPLAAFVLMIVARIKYPKNRFAKVLMWFYIAMIIVAVLIFILFVASCLICASAVNR